MFRDIPQAVQVTQGHLKALEAWRNAQGDPARRMRQVSPEAGKLLAILLCGCPPGDALEIGAGGGYATLWLALACRATGRKLTTCDNDPAKAEIARQSLSAASVLDVVTFIEGDALANLEAQQNLAFCFIDAERDMARRAYELALPKLPKGGLICVDNAISHAGEFQDFLDDAVRDERADGVIVPIGSGLLVCRKI